MEQDNIILGRARDLGGFTVRRVLPFAKRRTVGPFVFFDHMGPADFPPGKGMTVRPHPHIHLATVTYLFEGKIHHRDSLGSDQMIEPGAINWMTAGHGIVHSERTPPEMVVSGSRVHGIQCWVALPADQEDSKPTFHHYPAAILPEFQIDSANIRLLIGSWFKKTSPVQTFSDLFYADVILPKGARIQLPADARESAVYLAQGAVQIGEVQLEPYSMQVLRPGESVEMTASEDSRAMILGGVPLGQRYIDWNFVSSQAANIEEAKKAWQLGPGGEDSRFPKIPGDDQEFIPLPNDH